MADAKPKDGVEQEPSDGTLSEKEIEKIIADILIRLSDIARIARISQEQVLTDRIEDLIDRYEKNPANTSGDRKMP